MQFDNFVKMVILRSISTWRSSLSRFSQMLDAELKRRGKSEREVAREFGWSQQAFNTWLRGGIPRQQFYLRLGDFLNISQDDLVALLDEARGSEGSTKLPQMDPIYGKVVDRKEGRYSFPVAGGMRFPITRYCIKIDTKVMEPALVVGSKAWADPAIWPKLGAEVIVHARGGAAWIGVLRATDGKTATLHRYALPKDLMVTDVESIHVIALSERLPTSTT
jgi:transcriptional regulator with XRE-family HTH domain